MGKKLGDLPTMELARDALAKYARQADAEVVQAEVAGARVTRRPEPDPELEISVELDDLDSAGIDDLLRSDTDVPPSPPAEGYGDDHPSHVRTRAAETALDPAAVPCIIACKEDLEWFGVEDAARLVLARIDGESTIEVIIRDVPLTPDAALAVLGELLTHEVIALQ